MIGFSSYSTDVSMTKKPSFVPSTLFVLEPNLNCCVRNVVFRALSEKKKISK